jgi:hypothetical protein
VFLASPPDPDWTNLPLMPLMVPLTQEIIRQGVGATAGGVRTAIAGRPAPLGPDAAALVSPAAESPRPVDPASRLPREPLRDAGLFRVLDESQRARRLLAVNPDAAGSDTTASAEDAVRAWLAGATGRDAAGGSESVTWLDPDSSDAALRAGDDRATFALPLLIAALALALAEVVMARLFSHARADRSDDARPGSAGASGAPASADAPSAPASPTAEAAA